MSYQFSVVILENIIRADVSGVRTPATVAADSMRVWGEIFSTYQSSGVKNVLYVSRVTGKIPVLDAYDVIEKFGQQNWDGLKIAYVALDQSSREDVMMLKAIASQYKIHCQMFTAENEALEWLADPVT